MADDLVERLEAAINKLAKWRSVFAGWQLGTRKKEDPECQAVRDHRETTMLLRAEVSALVGLLLGKDVFTLEEFQAQLLEEVQALDAMYEERFQGFRATQAGVTIDERAEQTMKGWKP